MHAPDPHDAPAVPRDPAGTLRYRLAVGPEDVEVAAASCWAAGAVGVWERPGELIAWFAPPTAAGTDATAAGTDASAGAPVAGPVDGAALGLPARWSGGEVTVEDDRDWQAEWKATIAAVHAGRFAVVPTWLADDHEAAADETTLVLDPGRAFGSGHHATTTLCLELLDGLDLADRGVIDVGCGSGVLAIAAAARGARAVGSDVDPDAVHVTTENAARNGVAVPAAVGSVATAVGLLGGPADVVAANLVTDTVAALATELVGAIAPGGVLVASGIAADRRAVALDALADAGLDVVEVRERDGWIALLGRPATADRAGGTGSEVATDPAHRGR